MRSHQDQCQLGFLNLTDNHGQLRGEEKRVVAPKRHQIKHLGFFATLVRDQEVDGSNPFAPTTSIPLNQQLSTPFRKYDDVFNDH
jgi:hypothetical protein